MTLESGNRSRSIVSRTFRKNKKNVSRKLESVRREKELEQLIENTRRELIALSENAKNILFFKKPLIADVFRISSELSIFEKPYKSKRIRSSREIELEIILCKIHVSLVILRERLASTIVVDNTFHRTLEYVIREIKK